MWQCQCDRTDYMWQCQCDRTDYMWQCDRTDDMWHWQCDRTNYMWQCQCDRTDYMWKFHLQKIKNDRIRKNAGTIGMLFLRSSCVYSLFIFQRGATTYMLSTKMLAVYFYIQHNKQNTWYVL